MQRRIVSIALCIAMLITLIPLNIIAETPEEEKTRRQVYLHAFDDDVTIENSVDTRTVFKGDNVNVRLAVDKPNKAENGSSETNHDEFQYNLGGLTVRIYYNTKYLELVEGTDINSPIDYTVENAAGWEDDEIEDNLPNGTPGLDHTNPGYQVYSSGYEKDGTWASAYVTVFYAGAFLPDDTDEHWYNLCKLPLKAKEAGRTYVYIETASADDSRHPLELFAKNNPNIPSDDPDNVIKNFRYTAINEGYFNLEIKDKDRPEVEATPAPGKYVGSVDVELSANFDGCTIFYTLDGTTNPSNTPDETTHEYSGPITIDKNTIIKAKAIRSDGAESVVRDFRYEIVPPMPMLFDESADHNMLPDEYYASWDNYGYSVYASDNKTSDDKMADITTGNRIFYTFDRGLRSSVLERGLEDDFYDGDPETSWREVEPGTQLVDEPITRTRVVRLVTVDINGNVSDVNTYTLGLRPAEVTATPDWGFVYEDSENVKLECESVDDTLGKNPEAKIYYTLNDGDPRVGGSIEYDPDKGIPISSDTTITAASYYDGIWSEDYYVFPYIFMNNDGIKAFHPSGEYEGSVTVAFLPDELGRKICYEIKDKNGNTILTSDTVQKPVVDVDEDVVVEAWYDGEEDAPYTFEYTIIPRPPVFAPESTQFISPGTVVVFAPESNEYNEHEYTLLYTTDGSDPLENGIEGEPNDGKDYDVAKIFVPGHTVIKAVVIRNGKPSKVVTHTYDVVYDRPAAPTPTLNPGYYTQEIGGEGFETIFNKVPDGTKIYYTIGGGGYFPDPDPNNVGEGTYEYDGTPIDIDGKTTIKAVAVSQVNGVYLVSDVGVYSYTVTPQAPEAAPSGIINSTDLPVISVDAICGEDAWVEYVINGDPDYTGRFENVDAERFYLDTATGNAYRDETLQVPLFEMDESFNGSVRVQFKSVISVDGTDEIKSPISSYIYVAGGANSKLMPPFADKPSGTYEEHKDGFDLNLYSVYGEDDGVKIQYCTNKDLTWKDYDPDNFGPLSTTDIILHLRTSTDDEVKVSNVRSYVYTFVPPAPIITPISGVHPADTFVEISFPDILPDNYYNIYYLRSDSLEPDGESWGRANSNVRIRLEKDFSVKAYIENYETGRISENAKGFYIIEDANIAGGYVWIKAPYNVNEISSHLLTTGEYSKGIMLERMGNGAIRYQYRYKEVGNDTWSAWTNVATFDPLSPIMPAGWMDEIEITAWISSDEENTKMTHKIDFTHLGIPTVRTSDLPNADGNYSKGTEYYVENKHADNPNVVVFYTTDESDPITSATRKSFSGMPEGEAEKILKKTTVKTVYFHSCGNCDPCTSGHPENCVSIKLPNFYGDVGVYTFAVKSFVTGGGGGGADVGGGIVTNIRKYTIDIFGVEHPTHISYIKGYPDGSVRPNGPISREEIAAILYRIMPHKYDAPFTTTGEVFPDVELGRWSDTEIEYMTDKQVIFGYPDGTFRPEGKLTRAEFAALVFRFAGVEAAEIENPFVDLEEDHWAYNEILSLFNAEIFEGYEDSTFKSENYITRAETMTIVNKLLGRRPIESYIKSLDFYPFNDLEMDKWYYTTVIEATITHDYWLNSAGFEREWENWK